MKIEVIEKLYNIFFESQLGLSKWKDCVNWAVNVLIENEDEDNKDIILLASSISEREIKELCHNIFSIYLPKNKRNKEYRAGKYIIQLQHQYNNNQITIYEVNDILDMLYCELGYPDWLIMLSRNCEYATDVPHFKKLFLNELNYITSLWKKCDTLDKFRQIYDHKMSQKNNL